MPVPPVIDAQISTYPPDTADGPMPAYLTLYLPPDARVDSVRVVLTKSTNTAGVVQQSAAQQEIRQLGFRYRPGASPIVTLELGSELLQPSFLSGVSDTPTFVDYRVDVFARAGAREAPVPATIASFRSPMSGNERNLGCQLVLGSLYAAKFTGEALTSLLGGVGTLAKSSRFLRYLEAHPSLKTAWNYDPQRAKKQWNDIERNKESISLASNIIYMNELGQNPSGAQTTFDTLEKVAGLQLTVTEELGRGETVTRQLQVMGFASEVTAALLGVQDLFTTGSEIDKTCNTSGYFAGGASAFVSPRVRMGEKLRDIATNNRSTCLQRALVWIPNPAPADLANRIVSAHVVTGKGLVPIAARELTPDRWAPGAQWIPLDGFRRGADGKFIGAYPSLCAVAAALGAGTYPIRVTVTDTTKTGRSSSRSDQSLFFVGPPGPGAELDALKYLETARSTEAPNSRLLLGFNGNQAYGIAYYKGGEFSCVRADLVGNWLNVTATFGVGVTRGERLVMSSYPPQPAVAGVRPAVSGGTLDKAAKAMGVPRERLFGWLANCAFRQWGNGEPV